MGIIYKEKFTKTIIFFFFSSFNKNISFLK